MMSKNITIPLSLFYKIVELLDYWDVSNYAVPIRLGYTDVIDALARKKQSIDLRNAYAQIIHAVNDDDRHDARMKYLLLKRDYYDI